MTLINRIFRFFAAGRDKPLIVDQGQIDRQYRRHRLAVIVAITLGYGIAYTCRLGLSVVKKPLIDANVFSADDLGKIGSTLLYAYAVGKLVNGFLADHANIKQIPGCGNPAIGRGQSLHGLVPSAVGLDRAVGIERLVSVVWRPCGRGFHFPVVQQQGTRPFLRHLEHRASGGRRV